MRTTGRGFTSSRGDTSAHMERAPIAMPAASAAMVMVAGRGEGGVLRGLSVPSPPASSCRASANSSRTSPASRKRCVGSLRSMRCRRRRTDGGVVCGSASQSGSARTTAARVSVTVSPRKAM